MHRLLTILLIVLTFTSAAITQDKTPLPSEDTVNAFLLRGRELVQRTCPGMSVR